jgi:amino acid adenylation domain-containing protein
VAPGTPLFSALLNYRHSPGSGAVDAQAAQAWEGIGFLGGEERTNYPFTLAVDDLGEGFGLTAQVQSPVDPARVCSMMHAALQGLGEALAQAPEQALRDVDVLPAAERKRLLEAWNYPATPAADDDTVGDWVHKRIEALACLRPRTAAVVHGSRRLSYGELNAQANRLAHHLRWLGVGPDARVALCMERGVELVVAMLATHKAGGAYVPIDPGYPPERRAMMCEDSAPQVVLTAGVPIEAGTAPVLDLFEHSSRWAHEPPTDPGDIGLRAGHLAYVIYTSGSTGRPKAAQVLHAGLRNLMAWYVEDLGLREDDAVLLATSHSFDLTQKNVFGPLMVGATLHLADEPFDPRAIVAQARSARITVANMAPSAFHALLDADDAGALAGLRRVVLGGEPIQAARLMQLPEPRPQFVNSYGPTECSDVVAYHLLSEDLEDYLETPVPLGQPIRGLRLYVLDRRGRPAPAGVAGELAIGGVGVGRGYLNRPELTAQRFVADPFVDIPDARMYLTGDRVCRHEDGRLEFLGRDDFQVKIRGMRVELGEVEAWLAQHPAVREAVVLAREEAPGDLRLVAYVTPCDGAEPATPRMLRDHAAAGLPGYMVPAAYVALPALPLNPNGKLDRRALPAPEASAIAARGYEAPVGETEATLAAIWAQSLGLERVGRHDNFFQLGGHSLLAVGVVERMREAGLSADVGALFTAPTLMAFATATEDMEIVL